MAGGEPGQAAEEIERAALRRSRRNREGEPSAGAPQRLRNEIEDSPRVRDTGRQHWCKRGRKPLTYAGQAIDRRPVADLQPQDAADTHFIVGVDHRLDLLLGARAATQHVLHRRDAVAQAVDCAEQRAQPCLPARQDARRRRYGERNPAFEREVLEHAARKHVMRVVMGVDEPRDGELAACIEPLRIRRRNFLRRSDRGNDAVLDQNIFDMGSRVEGGQNFRPGHEKLARGGHPVRPSQNANGKSCAAFPQPVEWRSALCRLRHQNAWTRCCPRPYTSGCGWRRIEKIVSASARRRTGRFERGSHDRTV